MTASTDAAVRLPTRDEAERFLYHEARLLDERRLDGWLALFTPDGIYWLPIPDEGDGHEQPTSMACRCGRPALTTCPSRSWLGW